MTALDRDDGAVPENTKPARKASSGITEPSASDDEESDDGVVNNAEFDDGESSDDEDGHAETM